MSRTFRSRLDEEARTGLGRCKLKDLGCGFAIDDFGTGFSSFAYLRALPIDYLKIDGSFVRDIDRDSTNRALVQAMASVGHILGTEVIAEMVERSGVADILQSLGVDLGQGWLWGEPSPRLLPPASLFPPLPQQPRATEAGRQLS